MIPQHEIEEVLSRVDMAEVASDFLTLKKSGSGYMCNCPFHQEKTPSFHIYPPGTSTSASVAVKVAVSSRS